MELTWIGFRLRRGGAQEFFGVRADFVTCGKTLGGLPVGVLCGAHRVRPRSVDVVAHPLRRSLAQPERSGNA